MGAPLPDPGHRFAIVATFATPGTSATGQVQNIGFADTQAEADALLVSLPLQFRIHYTDWKIVDRGA